MPLKTFNLCEGFYEDPGYEADCQRTVNLYAEPWRKVDGSQGFRLRGTPGLRLLRTLDEGPVRGMLFVPHEWQQTFAVGGTKFYDITGDPPILIGTVANDKFDSPVTMHDNGDQIFIVSAQKGYIYDLAAKTLTEITDPEFRKPKCGVYLDGYFISVEDYSNTWQISELNDGTKWDGLDVHDAEGDSDDIKWVDTLDRNLVFFGERSVEIYVNTGNADFPFERITGGVLETGVVGWGWSVVKVAQGLAWLAQDKNGYAIAMHATGLSPKRVSTHQLEHEWQGYVDVEDAISWTHQKNGHEFWVVYFPRADKTWCYDFSTTKWHELAFSWDASTLTAHRGRCHAFGRGTSLVGDRENGSVYEIDLDNLDDACHSIVRLRRAAFRSDGLQRNRFNRIQIDVEAGVGHKGKGGWKGSGRGYDPQVYLRWSNDEAHTWSTKIAAGMGKYQQFTKRAFWNRLGAARHRTFEISSTEPVKHIWRDGILYAQMGEH